METFAKDENHRKEVAQAYNEFMKEILNWIATNPKLKTYFPSQEQANLENMSLEEFYKLVLKVSSLNWKEIYQANEELVKLFNENDYVKII
jgi:leucyl aminopeptidase (aminopeptidase T)